MMRQNDKNLKMLHIFSMGALIIGFFSMVFNLIAAPGKFPAASLFVTAIGAMLAVAVSTKYLIWQQYEK